MGSSLFNLGVDDNERPYGVRHSQFPVSKFPPRQNGHPSTEGTEPVTSHLERAFPCLFPFGKGSIECDWPVPLSLTEHVCWCLRFHDQRFQMHHTFSFVAFGIEQKWSALGSTRVQMKCSTFQQDAHLLSSINLTLLDQAREEEERGLPISNLAVKTLYQHLYAAAGQVMGTDQSRYQLWSKIWSTTFALNPPSLWITINPCDLHNPISQLFAGEDINLDNFISTMGPDKEKHVLQSRYRLPLYAYLIRWTGMFIFLYHNLAMPLFPNSTPLFHIHLQTPLFPLTTRLYSDIYDAFIISSYDSSLSTNMYNPCPL